MAAAALSRLIEDYKAGDQKAVAELMPLVYEHLRRIARQQMRKLGPSATLVPTALVNEVFLKLSASESLTWQDRAHFLSIAAACMRNLLVDYVRSKNAQKRGGPAIRISFDENIHVAPGEDIELAALEQALEKLTAVDERLARVVELRYLGGLTIEETAEVLGTSAGTVKRDWQLAKAFLFREMGSAR